MYTKFFGLNEKPFSITPDPRYLYLTRRHADALAHLVYGVSESGGFIQLTGEVGTGKTTLIRSLLEQLPKGAKIAVVLNPNLTAEAFLEVICGEFHIQLPLERSTRALIDALNRFLLREHAEGRRVVLVVDEAQTLSLELLEQVRLLTNLETAKHKLLQIILIGQPELRDMLQRADMRQVAQRITGRYHLEPLTRDETVAYVRHRMKVAGAQAPVFKPSALHELYRRSGGVPRLINVIADRTLLAAYTLDRPNADRKLVRRAAAEVFGRSRSRRWWRWATSSLALLAIIALVLRYPDRDSEALETSAEASTGAVARAEPGEPAPATDTATSATTRTPAASPLFDSRAGLNADGAYTGLFGLWGLDYDAQLGSPCSQAVTGGLRCLVLDDGSIIELRRLNRPTVLTLIDDKGQKRFALVVKLGYDHVVARLDSQTVEMSFADLTHYWHGEHTLLWRPVTPDARSLVPGEKSDGVTWLRMALAAATGLEEDRPSSDVDPDFYDAALEAGVRAYQVKQHLKVDGIVGAHTQIALRNSLDEAAIPMLARDY